MEAGIAEAKNNLSELIRKVEAGEEVLITRHGHAVAKLVRPEPKGRVLGTARGQIREIDPDWWKPMTDKEVEDFYAGR
jgi:prevent-host-death family protein